MNTSTSLLPIHALRAAFDAAPQSARLVISSPTGSGKSTEVPRWCAGRVLVVEPRRVACRSLAQRISDLEGTPLGTTVGYRVRDEARVSGDTRITLATPGIVLRAMNELSHFQCVILDEFHERSLDGDLLLALMLRRFNGRLVVMSATMQDERVATHVGGSVLRAEGRLHPVEIRHLHGNVMLPTDDGLPGRVANAIHESRDLPGDILVFLPGKAEISDCARALERRSDIDVMMLHGDLSLEQQRRVFGDAQRRKVVLATNVAETSITIPGIGVVIDSGLVRQTRYHRGRGHLALVPVAQDSADQRAGRAGRTGPGVALRLWSNAARLAPATLPEIFRESLVPLVLNAAAWGESVETLPLLDRPRDAALQEARADLRALGALDGGNAITAGGRELHGLPLDPWLGMLLVRARERGCLPDAVDLVAALSVGRPLFLPPGRDDDEDALRASGCDASALITAVRRGQPGTDRLHGHVLDEMRALSARLRRSQGLGERDARPEIQRHKLALAAMDADRECAFVPRRRGGHTAWTSHGTEVELARESAVHRLKNVDAVVALATRAMSRGHGDNTILVTCAMPVPLVWLGEAGLGTEKLERVAVEGGRIIATIERSYSGAVLSTKDEVPAGQMARDAMATLFLRGSLFRGTLAVTTERLERLALWSGLVAAGATLHVYTHAQPPREVPPLETWVKERVAQLGVESGDDLTMLGPRDLTPPEISADVLEYLDKHYPRTARVGDLVFNAEYAPAAGQVTLRPAKQGKVDIPASSYFPRFGGLRVVVEVGGNRKVVRGGG